MTLQELFDFAINLGVKSDPRGKAGIARVLKSARHQYQELPAKRKFEFDRERLTNPFADSRISLGDRRSRVRKVLMGVDIGSGEVMLATELNRQNPKKKIDLIIGHHPIGRAFADLGEVMHMQADILATDASVPINVAEGVMANRIDEVRRSVAPINHFQAVDTARLMSLALINIHTPCDNLGYQFIKNLIAKKDHDTVGEVVEALKTIPEMKIGLSRGAGPTLITGKPSNRAGKIVVTEFTGGTDGSKDIYEKMATAGVGTIIGMHMKEEARQEAQKYHLTVIGAGHIASDSLGMNLLADQLEKRGITVVPCSGFIRIKRN